MRSSSLKSLAEQGIRSPREYRDSLIHDWYLKEETINYLEEYLLRSVSAENLFEMVIDGEIQLGKHKYQLIWIHKPASVRQTGKAIVSFRYCKFLNCGYALVRKQDGYSLPFTDSVIIESPKKPPILKELSSRTKTSLAKLLT